MPKVVNHEKRKQQILKAALETFASAGYEETTMTHIANQSKISRPTVYQYFQNKEEILYYAIKIKTDDHLLAYYKIMHNTALSPVEKLEKVLDGMVRFMYSQKNFIRSLISYIYQQQHLSEQSLSTILRKRTIRLEHMLTSMIKAGVESGELRPVKPSETAVFIWNIFVALALKMSTLQISQKSAKEHIQHYLSLLIIS